MTPPLGLGDFDFALPPELIAQQPTAERSGSRLLDGRGDIPVDRMFRELPGLLRAGDLLVVNDTRVMKARLLGVKASGGAVEALVERVDDDGTVLAHVRASKAPRTGSTIRFADAFEVEVLGRAGADASLYRLRFPADPHSLLDAHGHVPLPPYIERGDGPDDERRYQTVFATQPGAVAAPTAALHFDAALLAELDARGIERTAITLHVGAGTFQPVRSEALAEHVMHSERFRVGAEAVASIARTRARGGRVVAVGTTSLRALESAALRGSEPGVPPASEGETDLFIQPGFRFRVVDLLLTNFHLPRSTLLMLVSAFAGHARAMALYRHAVAARYRFFSYGDAMLLERERR
ncbi:MAG TPA: tRNA preQ1(34) S-adenosylmethionine ribosyltransferase-isomerase QueA [Caldimonas sp.]|jgi:S-adenosylmethionine:tRNA ribosyltransferase-isomerase|nr:tRNA preQ1(34) S-adenosylmethionine ribosyltransferase-isomerase QueA [Caldimonas sp.]HEX2540677.1 tRNA preQ1(34) S-adenosylmethionine ribosyltransferase-isomerase QueA [Caldimonas sp.]